MLKALFRAGLLLAGLAAGIGAQTTELPPEEVEIVELLELLDAMDLLEEDPDMIRNLAPEGEKNGG
jgi:hypothetical protein